MLPTDEAHRFSVNQTHPASPGVDISALRPGAEVTVRTHNSTYDLVVLRPLEQKVLIRGGRHFRPAIEATVLGSSSDRGVLVGFIATRASLGLMANGRGYVTSPIKAIENDSWHISSSAPRPRGRRSMPLQQIFQSVAGGRVDDDGKAIWVCPFGYCRRRIESGRDTELRDRLAIEHFVSHVHLPAWGRRVSA